MIADNETGLPYAGRFWDVPGPGIEAAWHFGNLHKKMGPIYEWKVSPNTESNKMLEASLTWIDRSWA